MRAWLFEKVGCKANGDLVCRVVARCGCSANCSFFVPQKCVLPFHFAQSSVSAISNSRHDNVRASSTLFIWLNENVQNGKQ